MHAFRRTIPYVLLHTKFLRFWVRTSNKLFVCCYLVCRNDFPISDLCAAFTNIIWLTPHHQQNQRFGSVVYLPSGVETFLKRTSSVKSFSSDITTSATTRAKVCSEVNATSPWDMFAKVCSEVDATSPWDMFGKVCSDATSPWDMFAKVCSEEEATRWDMFAGNKSIQIVKRSTLFEPNTTQHWWQCKTKHQSIWNQHMFLDNRRFDHGERDEEKTKKHSFAILMSHHMC